MGDLKPKELDLGLRVVVLVFNSNEKRGPPAELESYGALRSAHFIYCATSAKSQCAHMRTHFGSLPLEHDLLTCRCVHFDECTDILGTGGLRRKTRNCTQ